MSDLGRSIDERRTDEAVGVVDFLLAAQELLLASLVGQMAADLVAVLLGLQEGGQVQARPNLLTGELTR